MIDIESQVYSGMRDTLNMYFKDISMSTDLNAVPSSLPHVSLYEADNSVYDKTIDSGSNENHVIVMYEVNIYSNKTTGRKQECKDILGKADNYMLSLGFTRISKNPIDTYEMYQIVVRYTGIVSKNKKIIGGIINGTK